MSRIHSACPDSDHSGVVAEDVLFQQEPDQEEDEEEDEGDGKDDDDDRDDGYSEQPSSESSRFSCALR